MVPTCGVNVIIRLVPDVTRFQSHVILSGKFMPERLDVGNSGSEVDPTVNLFSLSKSVSCEISAKSLSTVMTSTM